MEFLTRLFTRLMSDKKARRRLRSFIMILASVTVFVTVYLLILPAVTMDRGTALKQPGIRLALVNTDGEKVSGTGATTVKEDEQPAQDSAQDSGQNAAQDGAQDSGQNAVKKSARRSGLSLLGLSEKQLRAELLKLYELLCKEETEDLSDASEDLTEVSVSDADLSSGMQLQEENFRGILDDNGTNETTVRGEVFTNVNKNEDPAPAENVDTSQSTANPEIVDISQSLAGPDDDMSGFLNEDETEDTLIDIFDWDVPLAGHETGPDTLLLDDTSEDDVSGTDVPLDGITGAVTDEEDLDGRTETKTGETDAQGETLLSDPNSVQSDVSSVLDDTDLGLSATVADESDEIGDAVILDPDVDSISDAFLEDGTTFDELEDELLVDESADESDEEYLYSSWILLDEEVEMYEEVHPEVMEALEDYIAEVVYDSSSNDQYEKDLPPEGISSDNRTDADGQNMGVISDFGDGVIPKADSDAQDLFSQEDMTEEDHGLADGVMTDADHSDEEGTLVYTDEQAGQYDVALVEASDTDEPLIDGDTSTVTVDEEEPPETEKKTVDFEDASGKGGFANPGKTKSPSSGWTILVHSPVEYSNLPPIGPREKKETTPVEEDQNLEEATPVEEDQKLEEATLAEEDKKLEDATSIEDAAPILEDQNLEEVPSIEDTTPISEDQNREEVPAIEETNPTVDDQNLVDASDLSNSGQTAFLPVPAMTEQNAGNIGMEETAGNTDLGETAGKTGLGGTTGNTGLGETAENTGLGGATGNTGMGGGTDTIEFETEPQFTGLPLGSHETIAGKEDAGKPENAGGLDALPDGFDLIESETEPEIADLPTDPIIVDETVEEETEPEIAELPTDSIIADETAEEETEPDIADFQGDSVITDEAIEAETEPEIADFLIDTVMADEVAEEETEPEEASEDAVVEDAEIESEFIEEAETEAKATEQVETEAELVAETKTDVVSEETTGDESVYAQETETVPEVAEEVETETVAETAKEADTEEVTEATAESLFEKNTEAEIEMATEAATESLFWEDTEADTEAATESLYWEDAEAETEAETEAEALEEIETEEETEEANESLYGEDMEAETEAGTEVETEEEPEEAETEEEPEEAETEEEPEAETENFRSGHVIREVPVEGADYTIYVEYDETARIPEDAAFWASALKEGSGYEHYSEYVKETISENEKENVTQRIDLLGMFDLSIFDRDGNTVQPQDEVTVRVVFDNGLEQEAKIYAVHFPGSGLSGLQQLSAQTTGSVANLSGISVLKPFGSLTTGTVASASGLSEVLAQSAQTANAAGSEAGLSALPALPGMGSASAEVIDAENTGEEAVFAAGGFSIYAIVGTTIEKTVLASDGHNYKISVTYGEDARIPEGAMLEVYEILPSDDTADAAGENAAGGNGAGEYEAGEYEAYLEKTREALGVASGVFAYARFFDIKIVDSDGVKVEIQAPVDVKIELADKESGKEAEDNTKVVHFADETDAGDVVDITTEAADEGQVVSFEAEGFSVYAILDAREIYVSERQTVKNLEELNENLNKAFYLSYSNKYFSSDMNKNSCFEEKELISDASEWYFEKIEGQENQYYIYTLIDGVKKYMKQKSGNDMMLGTTGTAFEISEVDGAEGKFYIKHASQKLWLQHSNGGGGIRFYKNNDNATNCRISFTYADSVKVPDDYYELDGKTFGITYDSESIFCTALMASSQTEGSLDGQDMAKMDTQGYEDRLFVPLDSDITEWTFHIVEEDKYYITTKVDGVEQYLTIENGSVSLCDEPQEGSVIQVSPGTGDYKGFYSFSSGGCLLTVNGEEGSRTFTGASGSKTKHNWMKLAEKSPLTEDAYLIYTAQKISVSDPADQVVLYTRVWNGSKYEFYAIDYDGSLIRCYDDGDVIKWVGSQYETAVWELTEHTKQDDQGNTVPNGYYELKNTYTNKYIRPQLADDTLFSDSMAYLNLDGRYYQEDYTKIKCWDDTYYSYMGWKVDLENNRVVPCPSAQADDFYFARIKTSSPHLTEVETVDNDTYGITMKMIDFNNSIVDKRDSKQTEFFGKDSNKTGLVTTNIDPATGYPVSTYNNQSLGDLFSGATDVNHLFIQSVYDESGYFEYDSTINYAYLKENQFEVYDQLGTIERAGNVNTMRHGQFMPYNSLINPATGEPWPYSDMYTNTMTVLATPLPEDDPRYGEGLHEIPADTADYFFGMEMSASFTQTPSGLDAWGHDIIFEFSGDDDFWFYVDGELVLDLGGVHSAMTGSVNFRTGMVKGRNGEVSLRQIFENNYKARNPQATAQEVADYLLRFFDEGSTVFRDYSTHDMKVYYMERGAGASNLHMRFNLTAVKPGEVTLSKTVTGSDDIDYDLMEFPYQIYYQTQEDIGVDGEHQTWNLLTQNENDPAVTYQGSKRAVKYSESFTPVGESKVYSNVFFLKPGETASINMPSKVVDYKIVECGVNMNIFKSVKANNETLSQEGDSGRMDYETSVSTIEDRPEVKFENEVDPDSLRTLTISKVLWDEAGFTVTGEGTDQETKTGKRLNGYEDDETVFAFRVFMSAQDSDTLIAVRNKEYYVKDLQDNYCRWNAETQRFESLGIRSYTELAQYLSDLTELEKAAIIFETSSSGAVSKIPGGYHVEFRGLPVDSSFRVIERDDEIPEGYALIEYERDKGSYISEEAPNQGTIRANEDPHILVHNKRGWGLTVQKFWSDADYMDSHDDIYFAVYLKDAKTGSLSLLDGSVRKMTSPDVSLYYYFDQLETGASFDAYEIYEVKLTNPQTDAEGNVTDYDEIERIENGSSLTVGGKPSNKDHQEGFSYEVTYAKGEPTGGNEEIRNVRTDTVTNTRRGIQLIKTDWNETVLPGAVFTLKDQEGNDIGAQTYTSDADGLITIAYLDPGTDYTLEETKAPNGFQKPSSAWTISVDSSNVVSVSGGETGSFDITQATDDQMAVVKLKNKGFSLKALKVGPDAGEGLKDAEFALYRQVQAAGGMVKDQNAMEGYERLVTGSDGVIPKITSALPEGIYYLSEIIPPVGYKKLAGDLVFSVSSTGVVSIPQHVDSDDPDTVVILNNLEDSDVTNWITSSETDGHTSYTITIPNELAGVPVRIIKVDQKNEALEGAVFSFTGEGITPETNLESKITEEGGDALIYSNETLPVGSYLLTETKTPDGYIPPEAPVVIEVENTGNEITVSASINGKSIEYPYVAKDTETGEWTIRITNQTGYGLPATGGPGTWPFTILGIILMMFAVSQGTTVSQGTYQLTHSESENG